jgi:hypothetical protein
MSNIMMMCKQQHESGTLADCGSGPQAVVCDCMHCYTAAEDKSGKNMTAYKDMVAHKGKMVFHISNMMIACNGSRINPT